MGCIGLPSTLWILLFCSHDLWSLCFSAGFMDTYKNECPGTETQLSVPRDDGQSRYGQYREMYTNCTVVQGNLEIVFIELTDADFSFLKTIREVNGYVLIYGNHVDQIQLDGLKVIRGQKLFTAMENGIQGNFSLYVASNAKAGDATVGLKELQLKSLVEIMNGDIFFKNNKQLCFGERTMDWAYITTSAKVFLPTSDPGFGNKSCSGSCHDRCIVDGARWCYGTWPDKCQAARMCCGQRCSPTNKCVCKDECIGGCSLPPDERNCEACRHFAKNGQCVGECNKHIYNPHTSAWDPPSPITYIYGTQCMEKCPGDMLIENGTCVHVCSRGLQADSEKNCNHRCDGSSCPITCRGTEQWLHSNNIKNFKHCKRIKGNLQITNASFYGNENNLKLTVDDLEMLKDVEDITGILQVDAWHPNLTSLSFLKNLRVIGGIGAETSNGYSLKIEDTKLQSLDLKSLREIKKGKVGIAGNSDLCYVSSVNWTRLLTDRESQTASLMRNLTPHVCEEQGRVCSSLCSSDGCWGPGDENCLFCRNFSIDGGRCVADCPSSNGSYSLKREDGTLECRKCHEECDKHKGCSGDENHHCVKCKNVKHNGTCISECPSGYYSDLNRTCQRCHSVCKECVGEGPYLHGKGQNESDGCRICHANVAKIEDSNTIRCLMNFSECDANFYKGGKDITIHGHMMETCRKCHPECDGCHGDEATDCTKCHHYSQTTSGQPNKFECVSNCSYDDGYYDAGNNVCQPCYSECRRCYGPTKYNCLSCKNVRINLSQQEAEALGNETSNQSYCAERCPSGQNRHQSNNETEDEWCSAVMESVMPLDPKSAVPLFVFLFLIIAIVVVIFAAFWRKQKLRRLKESVLANDEILMLSVGKTKSEMSLLRHIKESELRRGNTIGSGAFGTVYKGIWIPEKENIKIPVAIKILHESSNTSQNAELLDEARIMASVCHPNCVRILAVCMTAQLMLITQLMPLGCLLDYVRKEKSNIGSRALLLWSVQIAKGMKYLEEHSIVHRNLAARNVLVQKPNQVKVADFGLAKLLSCDDDEDEFHAEKGNMPIRWMALESIQKRKYTHKSDVWSYGVTLWEMFSNGDTPYVDLPVRQIPQALEKGERLSQPEICSIDVYMIMIKCWMLDVDSRPTFSDLVPEFTRMAEDPGRFLVVKGDKLMRLPSGGPDTKDLVRMMSLPIDEPDLMVVSGEEYLRPSELDITGSSSGSGSYPPSSSPLGGPLNSIPEDDAYENTRTPATDDDLDQKPFTKNGKIPTQYSRQGSLRYIADPCRNNEPDLMTWDPHHQEKKKGEGEGAGGKMVRVDEDGYLPPQSANTPPSYLDVVYFPSNDSTSSADTQHLLNNKKHLGVTNMGISADNPNYFDDDSNYLLCTDYAGSDKQGALGSSEDFNQRRPEYCNVP